MENFTTLSPEVPNDVPNTSSSNKVIMSNKLFYLIVGFVVLLIVAIGILIWKYSQQQTATTVTTTKKSNIEATVKYLSSSAWRINGQIMTKIAEGNVLKEGDKIKTDSGANLVLNLDEGSVIRIGPNSTVVLSKFQPSNIIISENSGAVFARVNKDAQHLFQIIAGNTTVNSLGTAFSVEDNDNVTVDVFEHQVSVTTSNGTSNTVPEDKEWSNNNSSSIKEISTLSDPFIKWSLEQEHITPTVTNTSTPTPTPTPTKAIEPTHINPTVVTQTPTASPAAGFVLSGSVNSTGFSFTWQVNGNIDISKGFKIIKNLTGSPVYPGDDYDYVSDSTSRSEDWQVIDGQTWHIRMCNYTGDGCGVYSNEIVLTAPKSNVNSIKLSVSKKDLSTAIVSWVVDGNSILGYKVLWSKNPGPVYPIRDGDNYDYISDPTQVTDNVENLVSGNLYYFRVCQYIGGACGVYSNEVSLQY